MYIYIKYDLIIDQYGNLKGLTKNVYYVQWNMYQWRNAAKIYIFKYDL